MNNQDYLDENEVLEEEDEPIVPLDISQPKKPEVLDEELTPKKKKPTKKATDKPRKDESDTPIEEAPKKEKKPIDPNGSAAKATSVIFWLLSFLTAVFLIANIWVDAGPLIEGYAALLYGLFGWGALFTVCLFMLLGMEWKNYLTEHSTVRNVLIAIGFTVTLSTLFHVIMIMVGSIAEPSFTDAFKFASFWYSNRTIVGGGVLGGLFGSIFYSLMHGWVSVLILVLILTALVFAYLRLTPEMILDKMIKAHAKNKAKKDAEDELRRAAEAVKQDTSDEDEPEPTPTPIPTPTPAPTPAPVPAPKKEDEPKDTPADPKLPKITVFNPDPVKEEDPSDGNFGFDAIPDDTTDTTLDDTDFGYGIDDEDDIIIAPVTDGTSDTTEIPDSVFDKPQDDLMDPTYVDEEDEEEDDSVMIGVTEPRPQPSYTFPPIDLLAKGETTTTIDRNDLLRRGQKLVEVLKSFRVDTEIVNISCGPTVTRYELAPKSGVRVRAIANLVDDIALNLETSGVRIEAPIPGKAAVGVEVPNKEASTVYLRDLIESEAFQNAKSKLTACVGMDVSGAPILMDIAKMPHLLIAGATGMGKSVGVNSIIMSLLYKATPSELKLILVDPKKVELNKYNKLPHLLIPVVNNPKKAAGALATAVNEMERRFELIESVGARNLKGYNKFIENDPTKEQLPSIVIIIDELADLMMTAKDDVEDSICRIAQKARAAGIHLIICTQRPSVDVITGLIKANVPSRIAFTVASNIDSRTIIDVAGAEKLIGRGDMLFAPVGAMKPIRVQGSFVDDDEVEAVTDFIKNQSKDVEYDNSFLDQVEIEAERCGQQKKKVATDEIDADDDLDPKFYEAVELAVDMGKISTSLLQRKLSLGYGRAAKIIDSMESMGIVGAPDGQKPRNCLISRQEFQEMMLRQE